MTNPDCCNAVSDVRMLFYDGSEEMEKEMLSHLERAGMEVKVFVVLFLYDVCIDIPFIILIYLYKEIQEGYQRCLSEF